MRWQRWAKTARLSDRAHTNRLSHQSCAITSNSIIRLRRTSFSKVAEVAACFPVGCQFHPLRCPVLKLLGIPHLRLLRRLFTSHSNNRSHLHQFNRLSLVLLLCRCTKILCLGDSEFLDVYDRWGAGPNTTCRDKHFGKSFLYFFKVLYKKSNILEMSECQINCPNTALARNDNKIFL